MWQRFDVIEKNDIMPY